MSTDCLDRIDLFSDPRVTDAGLATDGHIVTQNPATGEPIAAVALQSRVDYEAQVERSMLVQRQWRMLPAPKRGEIVRRIGNAFR